MTHRDNPKYIDSVRADANSAADKICSIKQELQEAINLLRLTGSMLPQITDLRTELAEARARIATLEAALNRVYRLVCFEMAEPPDQGTGTLVAVATVVEEALGEAIAERGGL